MFERSGPLQAGERVPVYSLEAIELDATDLAHRAMLIACLVTDDQAIATEALLEAARATVDAPRGELLQPTPGTFRKGDEFADLSASFYRFDNFTGVRVSRPQGSCNFEDEPPPGYEFEEISASDAQEKASEVLASLLQAGLHEQSQLKAVAPTNTSYCVDRLDDDPETEAWHINEHRFEARYSPADIPLGGAGVTISVGGDGQLSSVTSADRHVDEVATTVTAIGEAEAAALYPELAAIEVGADTSLDFSEGGVSWAKPSTAHEPRYYRTYWRRGDEEAKSFRYLSLVTPDAGLIDSSPQ